MSLADCPLILPPLLEQRLHGIDDFLGAGDMPAGERPLGRRADRKRPDALRLQHELDLLELGGLLGVND